MSVKVSALDVVKLVAASIILVLVMAWIAYDFYVRYSSAISLKTDLRVEDFRLEGYNPPYKTVPDAAVMKLTIVLYNPSSRNIVVERLAYTVYVEGLFFGEGYEKDILVPAGQAETIEVEVVARSSSLLEHLADASRTGRSIEFRAEATAVIPVKLLGSIGVTSVELRSEAEGRVISR